MPTPGSWTPEDTGHTTEHNRIYNEGVFYAEQATPSLDVGKFLQIVGSDPIRVEGLDIDYQPAGDYLEAAALETVNHIPIVRTHETIPLDKNFLGWGAFAQGNILYFESNDGFVMIDVSDPDWPVVLSDAGEGIITVPKDLMYNAAAYGEYVFLQDYQNEFWVINNSDPENPTIAAGPLPYEIGDGGTNFDGMAGYCMEIEYPLLFLSGAGSVGAAVTVYNISDPANPVLVDTVWFNTGDSWEPPMFYLNSARRDGDTVRLVAGQGGGNDPDTFRVISCSAPYTSVSVQTLSVTAAGLPRGTTWIDSKTVALTQGGTSANLLIWDVEDDVQIGSLAFSAQTNIGRQPLNLFYKDGHVYFNGDNFYYAITVVNVVDRENPKRVGAYTSSGGTQQMWATIKDGRLITYRSGSSVGGDLGAFVVWGSEPLTASQLGAQPAGNYQAVGDYVESTDITNIVVVDNGMMPATPDSFTLYLEREV